MRRVSMVVLVALTGSSACTLFFPDRELDTSEDSGTVVSEAGMMASDVTSPSMDAMPATDARSTVDGAAREDARPGEDGASGGPDAADSGVLTFCQQPPQTGATFCADFEGDGGLSAWNFHSGSVNLDTANSGPDDAGTTVVLASQGSTPASLTFDVAHNYPTSLGVDFWLFEDATQPAQNDYVMQIQIGAEVTLYVLVGFGGGGPQVQAYVGNSGGGGANLNVPSQSWTPSTWLHVDMVVTFGTSPNVSVSFDGTSVLASQPLDPAFSGGLHVGDSVALASIPLGGANATYHFDNVVLRAR